MTPVSKLPASSGLAPQTKCRGTALDDQRPSDIRLDQYYTKPAIAAYLYGVFRQFFDPHAFRMVEPSAGAGAFFKLLPPGSLAYDVDPRYPGTVRADFLTVTLPSGRPIAIIGNPPFGKNASTAVRFFNHAARQASVIAMIFPRSFRKASIENRLHQSFHLLHEQVVPADAFLFRGKPYNVPATFQIWVRHPQLRDLRPVQTTHPNFEFTAASCADFALQRVGARAGLVHHNFKASPNSHYFIKGDVEAVMARLDFAAAAKNVAGNPSLSKAEIVSLYDREIRAAEF